MLYSNVDFYTRIDKNDAWGGDANLAFRDKEARYRDGKYDILSYVERVRGANQSALSAATKLEVLELDNFIPYVEGVNVMFNNIVAYTADYYNITIKNQNGMPSYGELLFNEKVIECGQLPQRGTITMSVLVSESLSTPININLWIDAQNIPFSNIESIDKDKRQWKITFNDVEFSSAKVYKFEFLGEDQGGNKLLNFDTWGTSSTPNKEPVPFRSSTNTWQPPISVGSLGKSKLYKFNLKASCQSPNGPKLVNNSNDSESEIDCECEPYADFVTMSQIGGFSIDFDATHLCGGTETLYYMWDYGDGSSSSNSPSNIINTHDYADPGTYTIQLRVTDPCGNTATATHQVVVEGNNSLTVTIEGATTAKKDQLVPFDAVVAGGTPPYTYQWLVDGGSPAYVPPPSPQQGLHKSHQDIKFGQYTPSFAPAIVRCIVTDAYGASQLASHPIVIEESNIEIDFNHLPDLPSGVNCSNSLIKGAYLYWAAFITPLFSLEPPLEFIWDFGDGTIINTTEPQGQCEHSFESDGSFTVKFKVCNPLTGACYEHSKTYCVGTPTQPTSSYSFTPSGTTIIDYWNSQPVKINFIGSVCAPVVSGKPKLSWQTPVFDTGTPKIKIRINRREFSARLWCKSFLQASPPSVSMRRVRRI